jgi:hypothetical protein
VESTATHNAVEAHDTAVGSRRPTIADPVQVGVTAVGSVEISAWLSLSTATHSDVEGQETP